DWQPSSTAPGCTRRLLVVKHLARAPLTTPRRRARRIQGVFLAPGRRAPSCEGTQRPPAIEHGDARGFAVLAPLRTVCERARRLHATAPLPACLLRFLAA